MSTRNLDGLLAPHCVALIGASDKSESVGATTLRNLRDAGFHGEILLVNPRHQQIDGQKVYPDVRSLPATPDLAVIATPAAHVAGIIADLGARGTTAAVVLTAGFSELGEQGARLQQQMLAAARTSDLRIIGPNCLGLIVTSIGLNATFAQLMPAKGEIAFVSQSGGLVTVVLDWAQPRGIGFSSVISLGDMADVDFGDVLEHLEADTATRAIVLYVEGITDAQKFMATARAAARSKPLLVLKVGRYAEGAKAAHSHTGALAGSDVVYDAAFRRAGMLRVETMPELFDALETLALTSPTSGSRLAIVTNGGGPGVIAIDALIASRGKAAELSAQTLAALNKILPPTWSHGNPIDMVGDSPPRDYADVLSVLMDDAAIDGILVLNAPTALADSRESAQAVIDATRKKPAARNVYTAWLGDYSMAPARKLFADARIPTYESPEDAVSGFMHRVRYQEAQKLLAESPQFSDGVDVDAAGVRRILEQALAQSRTWLEADEVSEVLSAYRIPALQSRVASNADEAVKAATEMGFPVALKIRSPQLTHKTDVGGVALNLENAERVRGEARAMLARVAQLRPDAQIEGFLVQEMAVRPGAIELIAGLSVDRVFGPVILFGHGGTAVELIADTSLELPPITSAVARAQMARTRVWKLLQGYRGAEPVDLDAIGDVLVRVGRLALDQPAICELDINPLLADARGVVALDARIMVSAKRVQAALFAERENTELVGVATPRR